ncbi:MAG: hypothetical protein II830_03025 [Alphaproteobacteria bacterium]|nr:hypothetical protein [Alphaproteobacteria bacterium]
METAKKTTTSTKYAKKVTKSEPKVSENRKIGWFGVWLFVIFAALEGQMLYFKYMQDISDKNMQNSITQSKKVYVYDLEQTLKGIRLDEINNEFSNKITLLGNEVTSAQKKIASLTETKDKDDFSEVYLQSLKLKRDNMIAEYNRTLEDITEQVNKTVSKIAEEKGASAVFDKRIVASQNKYVEDITAEVIKRVKLTRPKILDE